MIHEKGADESVSILIEHERKLAELYKCYSGAFQEHRDFWLILSAEEKAHASWVEILKKKVAEGKATILEHREKYSAVETSLDFISKVLERVKAGQMNQIDSAAASLVLEKSILEKDYFRIFESDDEQVVDILRRLSERTREHIGRIEQHWQEQGASR